MQITCYDRDGNEVKRVTSTDEGNVEDNEGTANSSSQGGGNTDPSQGGSTNTGGNGGDDDEGFNQN